MRHTRYINRETDSIGSEVSITLFSETNQFNLSKGIWSQTSDAWDQCP